MSEDLIRMEHIDKFYGRVQALDDVNFNVTRQEIVGLLGDNGAGKSTLIKVLSGAVRATSGDIIVRGKRADIRSTTDAIALGIETIYQDSALVTQLSIARNLFLGREPLKGPSFLNRMDTMLMDKVAADLLRKVGIGKSIPTSTPETFRFSGPPTLRAKSSGSPPCQSGRETGWTLPNPISRAEKSCAVP